jgi:hypothetical protein
MYALARRGPFDGWPAAAIALVDGAAERHGGWARWASLSTVSADMLSIGGLLPRMKGNGRTFTPPPRVTVWPHQCRVVFHDYAGGEGVFDRGDVRLKRDGAIVEASAQHRRTFAGARKRRRWSPLDALYFFGYALANYWAQPFLLSHAAFVDAGADSVLVDFDADWPAHCRRQRFWFRDGWLWRHDYVAEIIGRWARGAHLVEEWVDAGGLWLPRRRRVVARVGRWASPVTVLTARFDAFVAS